jgi:uridine kinase
MERNYPVEDVIYRYEHHVLPSYEKYIAIYREDVDIIVNNNKSFEPGLDMLHCLVEKKLSE